MGSARAGRCRDRERGGTAHDGLAAAFGAAVNCQDRPTLACSTGSEADVEIFTGAFTQLFTLLSKKYKNTYV